VSEIRTEMKIYYCYIARKIKVSTRALHLKRFLRRDHVKNLQWTSALLKALKINNLLYSKKTDGQTLRSADVQKSAKEFSHGLDFSSNS
jgi:hypothetical protein